MRAARTAVIATAAVLALGAIGCGSDDAATPEVPGDPVSVPIPSNPDSLSTADQPADGSADAGADATATATPDAGTTPPSDQSGAAPAAGTDSATTDGTTADGGGGTSAPAQDDSPTADSPPPAGSDAQKFEDFCAQNPGAC
jgi:hypothetical protein